MSFLVPEFPLGFGLAFVGSVPMSGPVAVLFIARLLQGDRGTAMLVALGGGLIEGGYALGIAYALPHLVGRTHALVLVSLALGAVVISTLGGVLLARPGLIQHAADTGSSRRGFTRGALSSLFNPTLIATWTLAVGTLYANGWLSDHFTSAAAFAVGVCLGSLAWFGILIGVMRARSRSVSHEAQTKVLRAMGGFLVLSGLFLCVRFVLELTHHASHRDRSLEHAAHLLEKVEHRRDR